MQVEITNPPCEIAKLSHKDRWSYFFGTLKERGIPQETSPVDYPEDVLKIFQEIMDSDYRDANNGESPKPINIADTDLFKMVFEK